MSHGCHDSASFNDFFMPTTSHAPKTSSTLEILTHYQDQAPALASLGADLEKVLPGDFMSVIMVSCKVQLVLSPS